LDIKIVGTVLWFELEGIEKWQFYLDSDHLFSIDHSIIESDFFTDDFVRKIGSNHFTTLRSLPYIFCHFYAGYINEEIIIANSWGSSQILSLALWLVKDNNVRVERLFSLTPSNNNVLEDITNVTPTSSDGELRTTKFTTQEMHEVLEWFTLLTDYHGEPIQNEEGEYSWDTPANLEAYYTSLNRFVRALRFITFARSESFLPVKISWYVGALETLFSTDHNEITHQISERVAKIMGGSIETKFQHYKLIKEAYNVRSGYVHGSGLSEKTLRKVNELSPKLDKLIRELMKLLFTTHRDLANKTNDELREWFLKLILE
jgi:hypothetical protein